MGRRTLRTSLVGLLAAGCTAGLLGTGSAQAAGFRGGKVTWYAAGERVRVTDTRADGYAFVVRVYDTRRPRAVKTCAVNGRGRSRVCDFAFPEGHRIKIVAWLTKGAKVRYAGSRLVRA